MLPSLAQESPACSAASVGRELAARPTNAWALKLLGKRMESAYPPSEFGRQNLSENEEKSENKRSVYRDGSCV